LSLGIIQNCKDGDETSSIVWEGEKGEEGRERKGVEEGKERGREGGMEGGREEERE